MKRVLLTMVLALSMCGMGFAQYESYWPDFDYHAYSFQGAFVGVIELDGAIVQADTHANWDALEVAFFVNGVCRGSGAATPGYNPMINYLYNGYVEEWGDPYPVIDGAPVYYENGGEVVTVMIYDHMNEILYEDVTVTLEGEPFTILTGDDNVQGWWDPENPIILSITSPETPGEPTVLEGGDWSQDSTWVGNVPEEWADVIINGDVFIPAGYIAYANNITINEGGSLTINEGGQLFHNELVEVTMEMNVGGYENERGDNEGYRLIASPVYALNSAPAGIPVPAVMVPTEEPEANIFDLYMFDQTQDGAEWLNYQASQFNLDLKKGYLYANVEDVFVSFAGMTLPTNVDVSENLVYETGHAFTGWNLLGNPYTAKAYIDRPFYVLNETGSEVLSTEQSGAINPMQGFFVVATAEDQACQFSTTPSNNNSSLTLSLSKSCVRGLVDRAIVNFGEGGTLPKFQMNPNHTKVYIPQDGTDYAVVSAPEMGEMPVNFKAETNGSYTMSFGSENVTFSYLHLIDNLTGADVDLLATPSYTFDATTTDYASRFRLVFATGGNNDGDSFAFFSNGSFVVSNEGEATLQVVDVMGRILKSENISGSASVKVDAASGVYMLRLVNGNDVKVQKVVVE